MLGAFNKKKAYLFLPQFIVLFAMYIDVTIVTSGDHYSTHRAVALR